MGLRISDLKKLTKADFILDDDGDYKYASVSKKQVQLYQFLLLIFH
jgi:hypothetical protein